MNMFVVDVLFQKKQLKEMEPLEMIPFAKDCE